MLRNAAKGRKVTPTVAQDIRPSVASQTTTAAQLSVAPEMLTAAMEPIQRAGQVVEEVCERNEMDEEATQCLLCLDRPMTIGPEATSGFAERISTPSQSPRESNRSFCLV